MEAETISRILTKLASTPSNALYQDEILSCYRDQLISTCSEELRLIRQRASNLGKNDGNESRAAVVLQRIMDTMVVSEIDQKLISDNGNKMNHDLMRSQLVFDRKCIPTIKELASCIHVKPRSLEALKKSLQFYFSDSYNQTSNASFLNCPKDKGKFASNLNSENIIQKLLIRLVSMVDFDYDAQQTVTSTNKLYKEIAHFKLYGTQEAHRLRSATEYDMDKFLHYYCASCCFIILLGNFKQQVDNPIRRGDDKRNKEKNKGPAKKKKGEVKDYVKQIQNSIVQSEGLSLETFEDILKHVQNIILEIQKRNTISGTDEKKKRKLNVHGKSLPQSSNSDCSKLLTELYSQTDQQTGKNYNDDNVTSKEPSTTGDSDRISEFDLICGRKESNDVNALDGLDAYQQWKKSTLENYMSDMATEISHSGHSTANEVNLQLQGNVKERRLKELAADKILRIHGYLQSN